MRAGRLRHRVAIQSQTRSLDVYGEDTGSWSTVSTVWASIEPISGAERLQSNTIEATTTHRVRMRGGATVDTTNRLLFGSKTFEIEAVIDDGERGIGKELMCREAV